MKVVVKKSPKFLRGFLKLIFGIKVTRKVKRQKKSVACLPHNLF